MERNQITDYLDTHLKSGHSEQDLRAHLLTHGWSAAAVEEAFAQYHHTAAAAPIKLKRAPKHRLRSMRSYKSRGLSIWQKLLLILLGMLMLGAASFAVYQGHFKRPPATQAPPVLTYEERQASDAFTVASGMVQYANDHEHILPTTMNVNPQGSIVFCGAVCEPGETALATLGVYKPSNVTFQAYSLSLAVASRDSMYLVQGAKCNTKQGTIGVPDARPQSMVVLYATNASSGLKQHCLQL